MSDQADLEELARRYLDLWQDQITALANDPEMAQALEQMLQMMGFAPPGAGSTGGQPPGSSGYTGYAPGGFAAGMPGGGQPPGPWGWPMAMMAAMAQSAPAAATAAGWPQAGWPQAGWPQAAWPPQGSAGWPGAAGWPHPGWAGAGWPGPTPAAAAPAATAPAQGTADGEHAGQRSGQPEERERHGDDDTAGPGAPGAAAVAGASGRGDLDVEQLLRRLADLEERLASLEGPAERDGGRSAAGPEAGEPAPGDRKRGS